MPEFPNIVHIIGRKSGKNKEIFGSIFGIIFLPFLAKIAIFSG